MSLFVISFWTAGIRTNTNNMHLKTIAKTILCTKSSLWAQMCAATNISNLIISKPDCFIFIYWHTGQWFRKIPLKKNIWFLFFFFVKEDFCFSILNKNTIQFFTCLKIVITSERNSQKTYIWVFTHHYLTPSYKVISPIMPSEPCIQILKSSP